MKYSSIKATTPGFIFFRHFHQIHMCESVPREIFSMVQEELLNEQKFIVLYYIDKEGYRTYTLSQYTSPYSRWEVVYCPVDQSLKCSCLLFQLYGYPCGHLFAIMKVEHLKQIPPTCIMNRWLKTTKSDLPCKQRTYSINCGSKLKSITFFFNQDLFQNYCENIINVRFLLK